MFLKLAQSLVTGRRYTIQFQQGLLARDEVSFDLDPIRLRSEAVHVSQIGFRPDDPVKLAFLSCWMGTGGNLAYAAGTPFQVVDDKTGKAVFSGKTVLAKEAADQSNKTQCRYPCTGLFGADQAGDVSHQRRRRGLLVSVRDRPGCLAEGVREVDARIVLPAQRH